MLHADIFSLSSFSKIAKSNTCLAMSKWLLSSVAFLSVQMPVAHRSIQHMQLALNNHMTPASAWYDPADVKYVDATDDEKETIMKGVGCYCKKALSSRVSGSAVANG